MDDVNHIVLEDVSWPLYEQCLKEFGDRPIRLTFDEGRLEIMTPLLWHGDVKKFIARLIEQLTLLLDIKVKSYGSATFRREDKRKGLEPDECYYFKAAARMRGVKRWNPKKHPAPELVVEIDITSRSIEREPIYAALGVPEIWRWDGLRLECLHLANDRYIIRKNSIAFPMLEPAELKRFISKLNTRDENTLIKDFIAWVRKQGWAK